MEFHFVVIYDAESKSWGIVDDVEGYFPDGTVWDNQMGEWFYPDPDNYPLAAAIDERAYNMLRTLTTLWPEVDHGVY